MTSIYLYGNIDTKAGDIMESVELLKIISEINRLRISNLLIESSLCVCELQEILDLPQVSVSKHLTKMRENKFVKTNKVGNRVFYEMDMNIVNISWIKDLIYKIRETETQLLEDYKKLKAHNCDKTCKKYNCPKD